MAAHKKKGNDVVESAIQDGLYEILKKHPNMGYIAQHVDPHKIRHGLKHLEKYLHQQESRGKRLSDRERDELVYKEVSEYVASGAALDEAGQKILLEKGLHERNTSRRKGKEQELEKAMSAFRDIYDMFKSGQYEVSPEFGAAIRRVHELGLLNPAIDVLYAHGLINERRYDKIKSKLEYEVQQGVEGLKEGIASEAEKDVVGKIGKEEKGLGKDKYEANEDNGSRKDNYEAKKEEEEERKTHYKQAAAIFTIAGFILIALSGASITGNVVGSALSSTWSGMVGAGFVGVSFVLWYLGLGKNDK